VDPLRELDIIKTELILKDQERVNGWIDGLSKKMRMNSKDKKLVDEHVTATKAKAILDEGKEIRHGNWLNKDIDALNQMQLLTAKPVVYLVNISKKNFVEQKNKFLAPIKDYVKKNSPESVVIPYSVAFEEELRDKETDEDKKKFLTESKVPSMLPKIITQGYKALNLIHFFTTGVDEVRCWSIQAGTKAPQAAGVIHTDFEKGFICAETYNYEDFKQYGSEAAAQKAGKSRTQGKEYVMRDGDIVFFKHNAGSGGGKKKA